MEKNRQKKRFPIKENHQYLFIFQNHGNQTANKLFQPKNIALVSGSAEQNGHFGD